jgi:hypothetical protein
MMRPKSLLRSSLSVLVDLQPEEYSTGIVAITIAPNRKLHNFINKTWSASVSQQAARTPRGNTFPKGAHLH